MLKFLTMPINARSAGRIWLLCVSCCRFLTKKNWRASPIRAFQPLRWTLLPVSDRKGEPAVKEEPRIILDPRRDEHAPDPGAGYSLTDALSIEEDTEKEEEASSWDRALRGGFGLRFMAFAVDHFVVFLLFIIFIVCGLLAVELAPGRNMEYSYRNLLKVVFPNSSSFGSHVVANLLLPFSMGPGVRPSAR